MSKARRGEEGSAETSSRLPIGELRPRPGKTGSRPAATTTAERGTEPQASFEGRRGDETRTAARRPGGSGEADQQSSARHLELCRAYQQGIQAGRRVATGAYRSERERRGLEAIRSRGIRAAGALVEENYGLIVRLVASSVSSRREGPVAQREDFVQVGVEGFLRGCARFSGQYGTRLATFVSFYVQEAVADAARNSSGLAGSHGGDLGVALRRYRRFLEDERSAEGGGPVTDEEVAETWNQVHIARYVARLRSSPRHAGSSDEYLEKLAVAMLSKRGLLLGSTHVQEAALRVAPVESLDAPASIDDPGASVADVYVSRGSGADEDPVVDAVARRELAEMVRTELKRHLTPYQCSVMILYFGLDGQAMDVKEIAAAAKLPPVDIREAISSSLAILRVKSNLAAFMGMFD